MLVTCAVRRTTSPMVSRLRRRCHAASAVAPTAPTPAASVGVASPARIEPSTSTISSSGASSRPSRRQVDGAASLRRAARG